MSDISSHELERLYAYLASNIGTPTVQLSFGFLRVPQGRVVVFPQHCFP